MFFDSGTVRFFKKCGKTLGCIRVCVFLIPFGGVFYLSKRNYKLKVIPLGGLQEIGKNITIFESEEDIIVVDCGMAFPEESMLGIDLVIPDISYLIDNVDKIRGIILTHGHEDHIGGVPYIINRINVPIYAPDIVIGLLKIKLEEHGLLADVSLNEIGPDDVLQLGGFKVEFISTNHSIPNTLSLAIHTPIGIVVHTSDFKIDHTPIAGNSVDLNKFARLGDQGVLLLLADSTNAERPGYSMSESVVGRTLKEYFGKAKGRIIVATFASNIHRIQQVINAAEMYGRKIAFSGRSMFNVVETALELGYINVKESSVVSLDNIADYPMEKQTIITTGTQGEPMSALTRIASGNHKQVSIQKDDMVIISASPIPGNEKYIFKVINDLFKKGAEVIYQSLADIHVSGHAYQEELKIIHSLTKPKYFIPVHGEYRHLKQHANLAKNLGMKEENIFILDNGECLEFSKSGVNKLSSVVAGSVLVDGLGVGDVGNIVLRDRKHLSQDGLVVVVISREKQENKFIGSPDIISRGFIYVKESESLLEEAKNKIVETLKKKSCTSGDWDTVKTVVKQELGAFLYDKTKRRPMILPIIVEV
jgi:ribonuclease J